MHESKAQHQGQFAFTTKTAGEYQACFSTHGACVGQTDECAAVGCRMVSPVGCSQVLLSLGGGVYCLFAPAPGAALPATPSAQSETASVYARCPPSFPVQTCKRHCKPG